MKKYLLEIIVFICGAVLMVIELVGSRILAPYLGTSIFIWTSLIGVILGSLSLGYWQGGRLADKKPDWKHFSIIILLSAIAVGLTVAIKDGVLAEVQALKDLRLGSVIASIILFAPTSFLLGMVSPYAARLKMQDVGHSGATVGNLYAISTVGSIFGTFLTGFFLIAWLGSVRLLILMGIILALTSLLALPTDNRKTKLLVTFLLLINLLTTNYANAKIERLYGVIDMDTAYNRVIIAPGTDRATERPTLNLIMNPRETQSAMFTDKKDNDLVFDYTKYYRLGEHFNPNFKTALMLGGGMYSFPKDFLTRYPSSTLDVVEIDPELTALAKKYFNLKDDPRLRVYHEDGRMVLNKTNKKYDLVYGDAFRSFYAVPYHLTTKEAASKIYNALNDKGVLLMNIISTITGDRGKFLRAELATYQSIFPQVYLLPVHSDNPTDIQNIMLVAIKSDQLPIWTNADKNLNKYLGHLWTKPVATDVPILTDDYAPVDQYIMKLI
ncbi:MAG: fused MFS/spermidine synthase [bacterium]|nr:fused MFS/spermidine synthase [bacterium]